MASSNRWGLALLVLVGSFSAYAAAPRPAGKSGPPPAVELRFPGHEPAVRWDEAGNLHMVFVRETGNSERLYYARGGSNPAGPIAVSPEKNGVDSRGEMGPSLEILPGGRLVTVYTVAAPGERNSRLVAQLSADGGATWSGPLPVNDDGPSGSHGFAATAVDSKGELIVSWLDSRSGQQGVTFSRSRDGLHFAANRTVDPRTCQCCVTNVAAGVSGKFWIAYRGLFGEDVRDIAVVRGGAPAAGLMAAATVSRDGWHVNACPDSGPRMAVEADGTLWVAWFTGAGPGVFVSRSKDGGKTFTPRVPIAPLPGENRLANHPDIAVLPGGKILVVYGSQSTIFGRTLENDRETWSAPIKLAENASHARVSVGAGRSALSFTARDGNDTVAAASSAPMAALVAPPGAPSRPVASRARE
jgi:hypothetical protein